MKTIRSIKGKNILITGGAGFIGSHLVDSLIEEGAAHVSIIDNMFLGSEDNLVDAVKTGKVSLFKDDAEFLSTLEYIFNQSQIDVVFNCATKALNYSFLNPSNSFQTNVTVALNLLEMQRRGAFQSLFHFSTSEVYGTAVYEPMDEKHPRNPTTSYAAGKAAADLAIESYVHMYGLDCCIIRPFNNFGPRQNYQGQLAGIIPLTVWRILNNIPPEIHGEGKQTRDFIYVKDTVYAVIKLFDLLPVGETVNISTKNQIFIGELILKICELMDYVGKITYKPERKADVKCHNGSNQKLIELIDFNPVQFESALQDTISWYASRFRKSK